MKPYEQRILRRLTLRRGDGTTYLDRWGISHPRLGGVLLHRMDAPDPGVDLHDHPWWFVSLILAGGYVEERASTRLASEIAGMAEARERRTGQYEPRGTRITRRRWSVRTLPCTECHRIVALTGRRSWSLVINGPRRGTWGFYEPDGFVVHVDQSTERRNLEALR